MKWAAVAVAVCTIACGGPLEPGETHTVRLTTFELVFEEDQQQEYVAAVAFPEGATHIVRARFAVIGRSPTVTLHAQHPRFSSIEDSRIVVFTDEWYQEAEPFETTERRIAIDPTWAHELRVQLGTFPSGATVHYVELDVESIVN